MKKQLLAFSIFLFFISKSFSQNVTIGSYAETLARMDQVLGLADSNLSFTRHPLNITGRPALQNMVAGSNLLPGFKLFGIASSVKILPFTWLNDYNAKLPYGYNNGPLFPNVGYQTMLTGGVFIKAAFLNIQFKPELVYAQNSPFPTFGNVHTSNTSTYEQNLLHWYWYFFNAEDAPERFGLTSNTYKGLGQSKITVNLFNLEAGVSTENMWWGPGVQNSIMMSNSAPGFLHWTFNTATPVKTGIGSFEWQIIGGVLKQSGFEQYTANNSPDELYYYIPKPQLNRYISGFTFNWHPKWVDGLFVGFSGYDYLDIDAVFDERNIIKRIFPVFFPTSNSTNTLVALAKAESQDYAYAVNFRQVFAEDKAEVYFEYARNDNFTGFRDLVLEPEQAAAYTIGASKFFDFLKNNSLFKISFEITHLQNQSNFLIREEPEWYAHVGTNPLDGYTNEGRYVGAGIGTGGNSLMFDIAYIKDINSFGIKFERLVHNNDMYTYASQQTGVYDSDWVDFSGTFYANIKLKKYLVSAEFTPISTYNYEYQQNDNIKNANARVTLTYFFN